MYESSASGYSSPDIFFNFRSCSLQTRLGKHLHKSSPLECVICLGPVILLPLISAQGVVYSYSVIWHIYAEISSVLCRTVGCEIVLIYRMHIFMMPHGSHALRSLGQCLRWNFSGFGCLRSEFTSYKRETFVCLTSLLNLSSYSASLSSYLNIFSQVVHCVGPYIDIPWFFRKRGQYIPLVTFDWFTTIRCKPSNSNGHCWLFVNFRSNSDCLWELVTLG